MLYLLGIKERMKQKKILIVFGTRPEAIKMCPLVIKFKESHDIETYVCVTGQHREMLDQVLDIFKVKPDFDLNIMKQNQSLFDITTSILNKLPIILIKLKPDIVFIHGDTTTTFATSLACYYLKIPVAHVEAGLRTSNIYSPFPEEFNRHAVSIISRLNFAPTIESKENLIKEGVQCGKIFITGNTAIDTLKYTINKEYKNEILNWIGDSKLILLTAHRRENVGENLENIFRASVRILEKFDDIKIIYPIHLNPVIRKTAELIFANQRNIKIIEPLNVVDFHNIMNASYIILTDSGGIQEEAPSLGKPVLVLRDTTERPEGVQAGTLKLVGTNENDIYESVSELLTNSTVYNQMARAKNPYGDGSASEKIVEITLKYFNF